MNLDREFLKHLEFRKIIKPSEVEKLLEEKQAKNIPLDELLVNKKIIQQTELNAVIAEFFGMPYAEIEMLDIDKKLFEKFTIPYIKKNKIVPIAVIDDTLVIAVGNPTDYLARSTVSAIFGGRVCAVYVPMKQLETYIESIVAVTKTANALSDLEREKTDKDEKNVDNATADDALNAPAVRLVDSIIKEAIPFRASDIHIEPYEDCVKVRYRIDGDLAERVAFPVESYQAVCARIKIISGMNIAERRIPQDGRINMVVNNTEYDFRVSTLPTVHGEKFVIRVLDKSSFDFDRKDLGFTTDENKIVDKMLSNPHGLILLTGPTGCGKSTTLYSFLKEVNKPEVNIVTVEDPVEYSMHGINQTQVNPKANMTFATALRSILRQDPDVIMIGEIRDEETAQIGIRAAITGHLVFSTLHTNDAPGAVTRLVDMGVSPYLVGDSLIGVISQRLVKKLCPMCKQEFETSEKQMEVLGLDKPAKIFKPAGCKFCNGSGYKGRMAVHEVLYITDTLREAINKGASADEIRHLALSGGLITLTESCKTAVLNGETSLKEFLSIYNGQ
ncbi:MAG: type II/IV secretion system protein [Clostridia bacterium]|nr:type II/IV secretion system protein [Clostridia bacterium]